MPNTEEPNGPAPFPSGSKLKAEHGEMLKRYREALGTYSVHEDNSTGLRPLLPAITEFIARGRATGALIDDEDERAAAQTFLDYWVSILYRAGLNRDEAAHYEATLEEFDPDLAPSIPETLCPYIGLDAFQEENKGFFYGRKALIEEMLARLDAGRLLAVVGPSGSGKSSAVLAGLLPALKSGALPGSERWNYFAPMVPGANPLRNLALAVMPDGAGGDAAAWVEGQVELFKRDGGHLRSLCESASGEPSVLVVDQFEEVFTLCTDESLLEGFVNNLLGAVAAGHRVVLTMRIEFQEQMPRLDVLYQLFLEGLVQVVPLSAAALRDAIEKPAEEVGLKFEKGIVDGLVKDIVGEPAGLPLLQFTLLELWRRRRRNRITKDVYDRLGGARRALTKVANEVYEGLLNEEKIVAKRIFLRLAWAGEGVEVLRNRVRRRELRKLGDSPGQADGVLRKLVAARLIRLTRDEFAVGDAESPDDQFEVAHEALIRNWQSLIDWLQAERETLRQRIRLRAAAEQWSAHGRDPGGLLGGSLLAEAARYTDLDELEKEFVTRSLEAEAAAVREREETRLRELMQVQALADEQSRAKSRLWYLVVALTFGLLFSSAVAVYAFSQKREAEIQKGEAVRLAGVAQNEQKRAESSAEEAETQSVNARNERARAEELRKVAEVKADEAKRKEVEAEKARRDAEAAKAEAERAAATIKTQAEKLERQKTKLKESSDALAAAQTNEINATKEYAGRLKQERNNLIVEQQKTEEEKKKAEEALKLARKTQEELIVKLTAQGNDLERAAGTLLTHIAFTADSSKVFTALVDDDAARVWDAKTGTLVAQVKTPNGISTGFLSPDGRLAAVAAPDGEVTVFDVAGRKSSLTLKTGVKAPVKLAVSADGQKLAVLGGGFSEVGGRGVVKIFDLKTSTPLLSEGEREGSEQFVNLAFSADGQHLALIDDDGDTSLVMIGKSGQVVRSGLGEGTCRPRSVQLLDFSPSPDLKASLRLETSCVTVVVSDKAERTAVKGLSPEQAAAALAALPPAGQQSQKPAPTKPAPNRAEARPALPESSRETEKWSIKVEVQRRVVNRDTGVISFEPLSSVTLDSTADERTAPALAKLANEGVSEGDLRDISDAINDFANKYSEIPGGNDPATTARQKELARHLFLKILHELDIPQPNIN